MDSEKKILENKYQFKTNYTGDLVNFKKIMKKLFHIKLNFKLHQEEKNMLASVFIVTVYQLKTQKKD